MITSDIVGLLIAALLCGSRRFGMIAGGALALMLLALAAAIVMT